MALNNDAVVKISTARFYTLDVEGAVFPSNGQPPAGAEEIGHTPLTDILNMVTEGGEKTVLGSLQNPELRTAYSPKTNTFNLSILQWDDAGKKLYLGSNAMTDEAGRVGPAANPVPTTKAIYILIEDGENFMDIVLPKAEILGSGDLSLADTESLAALPLAITPLRKDDNSAPYYIGSPKPKEAVSEG